MFGNLQNIFDKDGLKIVGSFIICFIVILVLAILLYLLLLRKKNTKITNRTYRGYKPKVDSFDVYSSDYKIIIHSRNSNDNERVNTTLLGLPILKTVKTGIGSLNGVLEICIGGLDVKN